ncbi:Protein DOA1 [Meyerozyma sp. JA9]|nr:Protein DOA1 [Meyerozyma sp. JA9]
MFKLSSTLTGHESDVRSVAIAGAETVISGSRDATVRSWTPAASNSSVDDSLVVFHSPENSFINAVAYIDEHNCTGEPLVASGGKDCIVFLSPIAIDPSAQDMAKYNLIGHENNVCALSYANNTLISGSWDATARVWDLESMQTKFLLRGHSASVWDVKILDAKNEIYLTASADGSIRKWKGDKEIKQYKGHQDVVRKLLLLPDGKSFASCSNDATIVIWDLESGSIINRLTGHTSFIYDLGLLPNGDIVSCGEDRSVRVWRDNATVQAITLPCVSVWCLATFDNGDFVVGGSDKLLRIFTREQSRTAPQEVLDQFLETVQQSAIAEQTVNDLKKTDIPGYEALDKPGKQEGSTIMVKNYAGTIEAHQWSGGEWVKIGDVVGSTGSTEKKSFDGKEYDFVFDVDVEDGAPPLKLPFNHNDNPYEAADKFLAANELPASYKEEVVRFILQNTGGTQLDSAPAPVANPYSDNQQTPEAKVIPEKTYFYFKEYKEEQLSRGFVKFNNEQTHRFSESETNEVLSKLKNLTSAESLSLLTVTIPQILQKWDPKAHLIGFDLMRVCIPRITAVDFLRSLDAAQIVFDSISSGLDSVEDNIALFMMILKVLNNLIGTALFAQLFMTADDDGSTQFSEHLVAILDKVKRKYASFGSQASIPESKHYQTASTSLSTLIYNFSVYQISTQSFSSEPKTAQPVTSFANGVGDGLVALGAESAYRLCIAYGNYRFVHAYQAEPKWLEAAKKLYGSESRFRVLFEDIKRL